ncbi:MAG: hypothetical protein IKY78_08660 [Clostridia bacterium]|nr:hypothetical protein [Clostridia bacterium]
MKKELKMKHIFIPVLVVVILLGIVAAVLSKSNDVVTPTDAAVVESHTHADGEVHYGEH